MEKAVSGENNKFSGMENNVLLQKTVSYRLLPFTVRGLHRAINSGWSYSVSWHKKKRSKMSNFDLIGVEQNDQSGLPTSFILIIKVFSSKF